MVKGSSYLGSTPRRALSRPRRFGSLAAVFLIFAVLLSGFATLPFIDSILGAKSSTATSSGSPESSNSFLSNASALWCSDPKEGNLGMGMDNRNDWRSGSAWYPHADTSGRTLTAQEAFGNGIGFTNFNGVGESPGLPWFWISPPLGLPESENNSEEGLNSVVSYTGNTPEGAGAENWYKNMNSSRTPTKCVMGGIGTAAANGILGLTTAITNLMSGIATFAFDPNFICDPDSPSGTCIDLVGIIGGGGGSDEGIIGKLTSSVYFPLLTLAALLVGIYIIWNGLAKRQFRETFFGVIWSLVVTILGIAMLLNPLMLAKAPMVVGNALTSCIVGAFTGSGGCAGDNSSGSDTATSEYCVARSDKNNFMDQAAITMTSMSCQLWKSFVLQPYAQGSFGAPLDELDASDSTTIAGQLVAKNPGFNANTFCVNTRVSGVLEDKFGKRLDLTSGGNKLCNLAIYQAYLGVDASVSGGDPLPPSDQIDGRWLKLAQVAASDEGMYRAWAPSDFHLSQLALASIGLLSAIGAAIVIFVVSAFALAFYVTSILMIAFAPFFLLAGVHPGRGRRMMVGWIGQVLSNVMKYAASAIFLVITIALYGAVLSNVTNMGAILIFMIILTVALLMYRREIVDMVGAIDLGGEKLSNKFAEKTMDRVKNTGKTAMAVGAGMTAGALANGSMNPFRAENWSTIGSAANDSFRRSIKSRPGMLGEVMKAEDRISADNRADMVKQSKAAADVAKKAATDHHRAEDKVNDLNDELTSSREGAEEQLTDLEDRRRVATAQQFDVTSRMTGLETAQSTALGAIDSSAFREYQDLLNQLKSLEMKAVIAEESGNVAEAQAHREGAQAIQTELTALEANFTDEERSAGRAQYNTALAEAVDDPRVTPQNAASYEDHVRGQYQELMATIGGTAQKAETLKAEQLARESQLIEAIEDARGDLADAAAAEATTANAADVARQNVIDLKPGQIVRNPRVRRNASEIAALQNDRSADVAAAASSLTEEMLERSEEFAAIDDRRIAVSQEVGERRQAVAGIQGRGRQISTAQRDLARAREAALAAMRSANPQTEEESIQNDFFDYERAEQAALEAAQRSQAIEDRRQAEGGLSEKDRADLFIAERAEAAAITQMKKSGNRLKRAGTDVASMKQQLKAAIAEEYAKTASASVLPIEDDLDGFDQSLAAATREVEDELRSRQDELRRAQEEEQRLAQEAARARAEAAALSDVAGKLQDQATSSKPVGPKQAARAAGKAARANGAKGLPTFQESADAVVRAQQAQAEEARRGEMARRDAEEKARKEEEERWFREAEEEKEETRRRMNDELKDAGAFGPQPPTSSPKSPVSSPKPPTSSPQSSPPRRPNAPRPSDGENPSAEQDPKGLQTPPRRNRGIPLENPTDNTPGADDGNPNRGGSPFGDQR